MDELTVLEACDGKRMTKLITPTSVVGYEKGYQFHHQTCAVPDIQTLSTLLFGLERIPASVIIRGELLADVDAQQRVLRRKDAYDGKRAYYRENPKGLRVMMADFDKLPTPPQLHPDDRLDYLLRKLPVEFHNTSYHYQWSASAGMKTSIGAPWTTLSCHLWFYMDVPRLDSEMMRWAHEQEVDDAVMRTVQPNYVAAPIFVGVADPFASGGRSGYVNKACHRVPAFEIPPVPTPQPRSSSAASSIPIELRAEIGDWHDLFRWNPTLLNRICDINVRLHMPIQRAIACATTLYGSSLDWTALKGLIQQRIMSSPHGDKHVYLNEQYLDSSYRGAMMKFPGAQSMTDAYKSRRDWRLKQQQQN